MKRLKFIFILILSLLAFSLYNIPDLQPGDPLANYQNLPDVDIRAMAEEEWREGHEDSALLLLDYLIAIESPDKTAALQQQAQWLDAIKRRESALGRLKSAGWGALSGEVDSFESLAGSSVADFFVYGDLRDLFRETLLEDDTDEFIVLLSGVGIVTTIFPPADPAVSLLKASKRTGSLSEPLLKQLREILRMVKNSKNPALSVDLFKKHLMPVFELARRCRNFSEFQTLMRIVKNSDQLKVLIKVIDGTRGGARKMAQVFTVAGKQGEVLATNCATYVMRHGQAGMDILYKALRKGPKGLRFVADHPTLIARGLKNTRKSHLWVMNALTDKYHAALLKYGDWISLLKKALISLLVSGAVVMVLPQRLVRSVGRSGKPGERTRILSGLASGFLVMLILGSAVFLMLFITGQMGINDHGTTHLSAGSGTDGALTQPGASPAGTSLSMGFILAALAAQVLVWLKARNALNSVLTEGALPADQRIALLENREGLVDLPLFVGLGFTVVAFIIISVNADMSRILAYSSTVFGILSAISLRLTYLQPIRESLIRNQATNPEVIS
ncbi:MAG: hypothetical protein KDL10_10600 [Kiritimatiellae bacterium]|nr:hypothetical protein [Kiritimatiellia bacterium]